jgi:ATP phosphoribosyltransferase regulatory subunit
MTGQPLPIQLFYSGEVFRQEPPGAGKQREFYQLGLESMGASAGWPDVQALLIALDCLRRLGVRDFKIALGHVGLFHGIVERLGLSAERADALRDAVDHKDAAWVAQEVEARDLPADKKRFLIELPNFAGGSEVLARALAVVENPRSRQALGELEQIDAVLGALGLADAFTFDLSEVRGLDYYTGIVFKVYARSAGAELGGGGRYDGLLGRFGWDLPAVGFSFTLDRLLPLVPDAAALASDGAATDDVTVLGPEGAPLVELFRQAWALREQGASIRVGRRA